MYPVLFSIGALEIRSSILFLALGIFLGVLVARRQARQFGFTDRDTFTFVLAAVPATLFLAALNGFIFLLGRFWGFASLRVFFSGGLVSFGAVLGALLTGWIFARIRKQPVGTSLDLISLVLPLILAVYRIGCLLNGCCYGVETDTFAGLFLPGKFGEWAVRYPTQIMLMLFDVVLFGWLWRMWKRKPTPGDLTLTFLVAYSAGRLVIDAFRDLPAVLGPLSFHQLVAFMILAVSMVVALKRQGRKRNTPA